MPGSHDVCHSCLGTARHDGAGAATPSSSRLGPDGQRHRSLTAPRQACPAPLALKGPQGAHQRAPDAWPRPGSDEGPPHPSPLPLRNLHTGVPRGERAGDSEGPWPAPGTFRSSAGPTLPWPSASAGPARVLPCGSCCANSGAPPPGPAPGPGMCTRRSASCPYPHPPTQGSLRCPGLSRSEHLPALSSPELLAPQWTLLTVAFPHRARYPGLSHLLPASPSTHSFNWCGRPSISEGTPHCEPVPAGTSAVACPVPAAPA